MGSKQVFSSPVDEYFNSARDTLGDIRQEGNSWYKYVKYIGGTAIVDGVDGDAVFYTDDTGYDANEVGQDLTDMTGKPIMAGTLQAAIDISTFTSGAFGWIKIKGPDTLAIAIETSNDGTPVAAADGDSFCYGDADGATRRVNTVHDADTERNHIAGVIVDASAKEVILDCPF